jgi:hypothetical protein
MKSLFVLFLFALSLVGAISAVASPSMPRVDYVPATVAPASPSRAHAQRGALDLLDSRALGRQAKLRAALTPGR